MIGCLVAGLLVILLFVIVPVPLWPFLIVGLIVLFVLAAVFGVLARVMGALFGRGGPE
ncbi:MAG TPA: hypothetical protein VK592_09880 [Candidatus Dormibacteraeota bacterium]|nr:hypothetical protein [Candidatus Dormibacteraeota bacterium]